LVTMEDIVKALKECYDPEIPVNVWDLGLIYDVNVDGEKVHVKMTLTAPGCPMHTFISREVKEKLQSISGVKEATVEVVWDPPWSPDKMNPDAKAQLGIS
jgi:FeS assembly SUF system protein